MFYIQIGDKMLFRINDKVATAVQEKEKIEKKAREVSACG